MRRCLLKWKSVIAPVLLLILIAVSCVFFMGCSKFLKLDKVTLVDYDGEKIIWNSVDNATSYVVYINGETYQEVKDTAVAYDAGGKSFKVSFVSKWTKGETAVSEEKSESSEMSDKIDKMKDKLNYKDSDRSEEFSFLYLNPVQNLKLQDGVLHWDAVEHATGYQLKINGVVKPEIIKETYYDVVSVGASESIFVKPVAEAEGIVKYYSDYSNEIIANVVMAPVLRFDHTSLSAIWDGVQTADGYKVLLKKDGSVIGTYTLGKTTTAFQYNYQDAGVYQLFVQTMVAADSNLSNSKFSTPLEIVRLSNPSHIRTEQASETTVNITFEDVKLAQGFEVKVNGVVAKLTQRNSFEYSFPISSLEQNQNITIVSQGNGDKILDANEQAYFELTSLAQPTNLHASEDKLKWNGVNKASGYVVILDGNEYIAETNEFKLPDLTAGSHLIKVRARGNGSNIIDSIPTSDLRLHKLEAPKNLKVSNGWLTWDSVLNVENYEIYIDEYVYSSEIASFLIDVNDLSRDSVIKVVATGNGKEVIDSSFSESIVVHRLSSPVNLKTDNDNIMWNAVDGASGYKLMINSREYAGITTTSFSWGTIPEGEKRIKIMAIGNGQTFFESEFSPEIVVEKLSAPVIGKGETYYQWSRISLAFQYELFEDGSTWRVSSDVNTYRPNYASAGKKVLKVRAVGNGNTTVTSEWASITHEVVIASGLPAQGAFFVEKRERDFLIHIKQPLHGATYLYNIDGKDFPSQESSYAYTRVLGGKFTVKIALKGDGFNTINSSYCESQSYSILNQPNDVALIYNQQDLYTLKWEHVSGAMRYRLQYRIYYEDNTIFEQPAIETTSTSIVMDLANVTKVQVWITTIGDNHTIFSSATKEAFLVPLGG